RIVLHRHRRSSRFLRIKQIQYQRVHHSGGGPGVEPLRESFTLAFGKHVGEGPDVTSQGIEFRAVGEDGLEPELFDLGQRLGPAEDPSRHHAGADGCAVTGRGEVRFWRR
ncbi:hypothetical protein, partial [Streptomyces sp. NPDC058955]|uniref:hypothetical protein n=1 Tax=unclassified Streptomyces TaxID=2593676 RepID=UPI003656212D